QLAIGSGPPDDVVAQLHRHSRYALGAHHGEAVMYLARREERPFGQHEGPGGTGIAADLAIAHPPARDNAPVIAEVLRFARTRPARITRPRWPRYCTAPEPRWRPSACWTCARQPKPPSSGIDAEASRLPYVVSRSRWTEALAIDRSPSRTLIVANTLR